MLSEWAQHFLALEIKDSRHPDPKAIFRPRAAGDMWGLIFTRRVLVPYIYVGVTLWIEWLRFQLLLLFPLMEVENVSVQEILDTLTHFPLNHKGGRLRVVPIRCGCLPRRSCESTRGAWPGRLSVAEWRHGLPVVVLVATFVRSFPMCVFKPIWWKVDKCEKDLGDHWNMQSWGQPWGSFVVNLYKWGLLHFGAVHPWCHETGRGMTGCWSGHSTLVNDVTCLVMPYV